MAGYLWKLHGPAGEELRATEAFASQEEAEAWMGAEWATLRAEGAESVSLFDGEEVVYDMGLGEE